MLNLATKSLFGIALLALSGCSSAGEPEKSASALTVKTNALACTTKESAETEVVCDATVSQVQVTEHALAFSINAFVWDLLPRVCPDYDRDPTQQDPQGFNEKVKAELTATVAKSGTGWSVDSVSCKAAQ